METRADPAPSDEPSSPPAAAYPRWILLDYYGCCEDHPDARTVEHARTSRGHPISVSFVLAAPPAVSRLRLHSPGQLPEGVSLRSYAIAAHGDSVIVKFDTWSDSSYGDDDWVDYHDYFLYRAGAAARPPSLSLLPRSYISLHTIALLRRGQDEVVVAALDFHLKKNQDDVLEAELWLLRSGDWEWELKRLPVVIHDEGKREEVSSWETHRVIPVGDRFMLWVDIYRGIIYSDLWQELPELRYVSLPVETDPSRSRGDRVRKRYRSVCATDGGAVRFVAVCPRCCCGCRGTAACTVSRHAFTITMTTWDIVSVVDCDEIWSLPGYDDGVARIRPEYPTLSLEDPDILYFKVNNNMYDMDDFDGDHGKRLMELDNRRMELRSIRYYGNEESFGPYFIPSVVSQYFDASSRSGTPVRRRIDTDVEAPVRTLKSTFPRAAPPEEMLATLREIPDLDRDDMLKVYAVLAWDKSQFKFRSLLGLPMLMRKDYCLSIGKVSSFDV